MFKIAGKVRKLLCTLMLLGCVLALSAPETKAYFNAELYAGDQASLAAAIAEVNEDNYYSIILTADIDVYNYLTAATKRITIKNEAGNNFVLNIKCDGCTMSAILSDKIIFDSSTLVNYNLDDALIDTPISITGNNSAIGNNNIFEGNDAVSSTHKQGGAVRTSNNLSIADNNIFRNNSADGQGYGGLGGAIYAAANLTIGNNNTFKGNYTSGSYGTAGYPSFGGAIYAGGNLIIGNNNSFEGNYASRFRSYGGAIHVGIMNSGSVASSLTIGNENVFKGNYASNSDNGAGYGGAIFVGDALYHGRSNNSLTIGNKNIFEDNFASGIGNYSGCGGAIYIGGSTTTPVNSNNFVIGAHNIFKNNIASNNGGAISSNSGSNNTHSLTIDDNNIFEDNSAGSNGGAIHLTYIKEVKFGAKNVFKNNVAGGNGGALYIYGQNNAKMLFDYVKVEDTGLIQYNPQYEKTIFDGNKATNTTTTAASGGAIYNEGTNVYTFTFKQNTDFINNEAKTNGGAIYNAYGNMIFTHGYWKMDDAQYSTDWMYEKDTKTGLAPITMLAAAENGIRNNLAFATNAQNALLDILYLNNPILEKYDFKYDGGPDSLFEGQYSMGDKTISVNLPLVTARMTLGNLLPHELGHAYQASVGYPYNLTEELEVERLSWWLTYNVDSSAHVLAAFPQLEAYTIQNLTANDPGALDYISGLPAGPLFNTAIEELRAQFLQSVAGIAMTGHNDKMLNTLAQEKSWLSMYTFFNGDTAKGKELFLTWLKSKEHSSYLGLEEHDNVHMYYTDPFGKEYNKVQYLFGGNKAGENGGAIYNSGTMFFETDAYFNQNSAGKSGGAVYNQNGTMNFTYAGFSNNTAKENGGAIYNNYGAINFFYKSFFNNNSADGLGGAIYNAAPRNIYFFADAWFTDNMAGGVKNDIHNLGIIHYNTNFDLLITNPVITGTGTINKTGSNPLFFMGDLSAYTGNFNVKEGSLRINSNTVFNPNRPIIFSDGTTLNAVDNTIQTNIPVRISDTVNFLADMIVDAYGDIDGKKVGASQVDSLVVSGSGKIKLEIMNIVNNIPESTLPSLGDLDYTVVQVIASGSNYVQLVLEESTLYKGEVLTDGKVRLWNLKDTIALNPAPNPDPNPDPNPNPDPDPNPNPNPDPDPNPNPDPDPNPNPDPDPNPNPDPDPNPNPDPDPNPNPNPGPTFPIQSNTSNDVITQNNVTIDGNTSPTSGAVVDSTGNNSNLTFTNSNFSNNSSGVNGGVMSVTGTNSNLSVDNSLFSSNTSVGDGGAVFAQNTNVNVSGSLFSGNTADGNGGAVSVLGGNTATFTDTSFINNEAQGNGGAIYGGENSTIIIEATQNASNPENVVVFGGNKDNVAPASPFMMFAAFAGSGLYDEGDNFISDGTNAIYLDNNAKAELRTANDARIEFRDPISGANSAEIRKVGLGTVALNGDNSNFLGNFIIEDGYVKAYEHNNLTLPQNVVLKDFGILDLRTNTTGNIVYGTNLVSNATGLGFGRVFFNVDLANQTNDKLVLAGTTEGNILANIHVTSDSPNTNQFTLIEGAGNAYTFNHTLSIAHRTVASPLYMYQVDPVDGDNTKIEISRIVFNNGGGNNSGSNGGVSGAVPEYNGLNPSLRRYGASATVSVANINSMNDSVFSHMDGFMHGAKFASTRTDNKYAINTDSGYDVAADELVTIRPDKGEIWFTPFAAFEHVRVKESGSSSTPPKFSNNVTGALIGADFPSTKLGRGTLVSGIFGGYTDSNQHFTGVKIDQNQGMGGLYANWFNGRTYVNAVANAGGIHYDNRTDFGKDSYSALNAGIAVKLGHNFILPGGILLQPATMVSYQFLNAEDYTNVNGLKVKQDAIHSIRVQPGIKIAKTFGSVQPYITAQYNLFPKSDASVTVSVEPLPVITNKPFFEFGLGVTKFVTERWGGFLETTCKTGGITGVQFKGGLNFRI